MAKQIHQGEIIADQDPWRWVTFSGFWGGVYYLIIGASLVAGNKSVDVRINRRAALISFLIYITTFVSGGVLFSFIEQLIVRKSATEQSRTAIASGALEPSIPLQAIGGAASAIVPLTLVIGSNEIARRITNSTVFAPTNIAWARTITVAVTLSGLASLAVSRIAAWIADDTRHARRGLRMP